MKLPAIYKIAPVHKIVYSRARYYITNQSMQYNDLSKPVLVVILIYQARINIFGH